MATKTKFTKSDVKKLYKSQAKKYAEYAPDSFSWRYLEKPLIDKLFSKGLKKSAKILDAGCGTGRLLSYLTKSKVQAKNIIGVDFSPEMLSIARENNPKVKIVESDLSHFNSATKFDLIICAHVMHFLDKTGYKKTLENFYTLLGPNGRLFVVLTHPFRTVRRDLSQYFKRDWIVDHTPWGTKSPLFLRPISDIVNGVIDAGFTIQSLEETSIPNSAQKVDPDNYQKYSLCPSRIAILAKKSPSSTPTH